MTTPDDKTLDDLVRRLRGKETGQNVGIATHQFAQAADAITALRERIAALQAEVNKFKADRMVLLETEKQLRERIAALEAQNVALRRVVAAADAMRDMYVECARSIDCDMPRTVTAYNAARAALKEGK